VPRLTIVIAADGNTEALEGTLVSVLENRPFDTEIVVALTEPYADPYDLKGEVRFVMPCGRDSLLSSIATAVESVKAPFVHLLSSGCKVTEGWADRALQRFGDRQVAAVAPLAVRADNEDRIFAAGIGYRPSGRRYRVAQNASTLDTEIVSQIVGPGGFAAFYRRSAIDLVGGLDRMLGKTQADADLALSLAAAGCSVAFEPQSRVLAGPDVDLDLPGYRQALADERLFWRYLNPRRRWQSIAAHAALVGWEALRGIPRVRVMWQVAGHIVGCVLPAKRRASPAAQTSGAPRAKGPWRIDRPHLGTLRGESTHATSSP
jgi:hypothetical protein